MYLHDYLFVFKHLFPSANQCFQLFCLSLCLSFSLFFFLSLSPSLSLLLSLFFSLILFLSPSSFLHLSYNVSLSQITADSGSHPALLWRGSRHQISGSSVSCCFSGFVVLLVSVNFSLTPLSSVFFQPPFPFSIFPLLHLHYIR